MTPEQIQKLRYLVLEGCNLADQYRILIGLAVGELEQLQAENERLQKVADQATKRLIVRGNGSIWAPGCADDAWIGSESETPELFEWMKEDAP